MLFWVVGSKTLLVQKDAKYINPILIVSSQSRFGWQPNMVKFSILSYRPFCFFFRARKAESAWKISVTSSWYSQKKLQTLEYLLENKSTMYDKKPLTYLKKLLFFFVPLPYAYLCRKHFCQIFTNLVFIKLIQSIFSWTRFMMVQTMVFF